MQLCASVVSLDDEVVEGNTSFSLMLEPVVPNERLNIQPPVTVTIEDNDGKYRPNIQPPVTVTVEDNDGKYGLNIQPLVIVTIEWQADIMKCSVTTCSHGSC